MNTVLSLHSEAVCRSLTHADGFTLKPMPPMLRPKHSGDRLRAKYAATAKVAAYTC